MNIHVNLHGTEVVGSPRVTGKFVNGRWQVWLGSAKQYDLETVTYVTADEAQDIADAWLAVTSKLRWYATEAAS